MNNKITKILSGFVTAILALSALSITIITLYVLGVSHWHGPFRDMWEIYPFLVKIIDKGWVWADLWELYGYSHRLVIPKLLYVADYQWANATNHLLIGVSIFCQLSIAIIFSYKIFRYGYLTRLEKISLAAVVLLLQFSGTLLFNFMHTFDVQWFLCVFFIVFGCLFLTNKNIKPLNRVIIPAIFFAAACWCNFSAMAIWPIWILFFIKGRQEHKILLPGLVFLAGFVWFSAGGARTGFDTSSTLAAVKWIFHTAVYFPLVYLGNPLSDPDYMATGYTGILFSVLAIYFLLKVWHRYFFCNTDGSCYQENLFFPCLALFSFGVAVMTGIGRGYDFSHVHAMRYQNIVLLFWASMGCLIVIEIKHHSIFIQNLVKGAMGVALILFLSCQPQVWNENLLLGRNVARSHLALMMGFSDDVPMIAATVSRSMIYVPGYNLEKERLLHEKSRTGIYSGRMASAWLDGIDLSVIKPACVRVTWKVSRKRTPYTRFNEFIVQGNLGAYDWAILLDEGGKALALARLDKGVDLGAAFHQGASLMKGYSKVVDQFKLKKGVLVLGRDTPPFNDCSSIIPPD